MGGFNISYTADRFNLVLLLFRLSDGGEVQQKSKPYCIFTTILIAFDFKFLQNLNFIHNLVGVAI